MAVLSNLELLRTMIVVKWRLSIYASEKKTLIA